MAVLEMDLSRNAADHSGFSASGLSETKAQTVQPWVGARSARSSESKSTLVVDTRLDRGDALAGDDR